MPVDYTLQEIPAIQSVIDAIKLRMCENSRPVNAEVLKKNTMRN